MNEDERGGVIPGIPKLRLLVVLEYYLGVPWALSQDYPGLVQAMTRFGV